MTPRSCLPLAYLDLGGSINGRAGTQLLKARLPAVEKTLEGNGSDQPVLVAKACNNKASFYAIERVDPELYVLCPLADWVTVEALVEIQNLSVNDPLPRKRCRERISPQDSDWWRELAIKDARDTRLELDIKATKITSSVRLCLNARWDEKSPPVLNTLQLPACVFQEQATPTVENFTDAEHQERPTQSMEDVFSMLRTQYQEALYISKVNPITPLSA